jgi:hypothetical protein
MKMSLQRRASLGGATVGALTIDGVHACYTLEDEVREVPGVPVLNWKIKGSTAIPAGLYHITLELSPRFGPDTLTINGVVGFSGVRIHAGNTSADTEGCILLGTRATQASLVGGTSREAVALVKLLVKAAITRGERVTLNIINAVELA